MSKDMSKYYTMKKGTHPKRPKILDDDRLVFFSPKAWYILLEDGKYTLHYISGELAGRGKQIEISKLDYIKAKAGEMDLTDFCTKYNVF